MEIPAEKLTSLLRQYNPWWSGNKMQGLPEWRRAAFRDIATWMQSPPAPRAVLLSGARQIGKTTLVLQCIETLLASGVPPQNILYATLDDPLIKLSGIDAVLDNWQDFEPPREGTRYLFLDEIQYARDWQTWLKLQVDFHKDRRILVTGSSTPLVTEGQESGVGRWHTIRLATLSFFEYLKIRQVPEFPIPAVASLPDIFDWSPPELSRTSESARPLVPHFHEYLMRGGFPQCALVENVELAQRLLRDDIVDKVLKRDMTALFGVRNIIELEKLFLYLCLHDGGLLDMGALCSSLELKKQTVSNYLSLFETTHLIYRLRQFGYGKEVLRGKYKVYLADAAIAPSVFSRGKAMLTHMEELGNAVETAVFKHLLARYYGSTPYFSYWRGKKEEEVDVIADVKGRLVPFEVKYRETETRSKNLAGIVNFCRERKVPMGYVVTKNMADFSVSTPEHGDGVRLLKIPAPLFCYWLGQSEIQGTAP
jgi:uncharacterized protein